MLLCNAVAPKQQKEKEFSITEINFLVDEIHFAIFSVDAKTVEHTIFPLLYVYLDARLCIGVAFAI